MQIIVFFVQKGNFFARKKTPLITKYVPKEFLTCSLSSNKLLKIFLLKLSVFKRTN